MKKYIHLLFLAFLTVYSIYITKNPYFILIAGICSLTIFIKRFEVSLFSILFLVFYIIFSKDPQITHIILISFLILAYMEFHNFYLENFYPEEIFFAFSISLIVPFVFYFISSYFPELPASYLLFFLIVALFVFFYLIFTER